MEPYYRLEQGELSARMDVRRAHPSALVLWLRKITLFVSAFDRVYDPSHLSDPAVRQAYFFRLEWLGLAGSNFKLALDALMAGYYSACMALERHMLETWRRVVYARLSSDDIWRWYPQEMWPDDIGGTGRASVPPKYPDAKQIGKVIEARGNARDESILLKVQQGFDQLSDHSHPTLEGATQTWDLSDPGRRVFGPTFSELHCHECLRWGLFAGAILLEEIMWVESQGNLWTEELRSIGKELEIWLINHRR